MLQGRIFGLKTEEEIMWWDGYVARMGEMRNTHENLKGRSWLEGLASG